MSTKEPNTFCIYNSRNATLVSPHSNQPLSKQTLAHFLKPCSNNNPPTTLSSETVSPINKKLHFKGWKNPQTKWGDWFETLTAKHAFTWNQTGLCDALLSSLYHFPPNPCLILALVQHWSPKTNTFVFPWGEATITLEDVMILGGFPILGESVTLPLSSDMFSVEAKLIELRRGMSKSKSKKADHNTWLMFFKEELKSCELFELEYVGFLSLWLSRFVFPSFSVSVIDPRVFPIAIHLSQGTRIALAPSVLASIYHNLSLLKEKLISSSVKDLNLDLDLKVNGLFQIVQHWLFERFPNLGPKCPNELKKGEPRAARWHRLSSESDHASFEFILSALESRENFRWRPYVVDLKNWCFMSYYKENEQFVDDLNSDLAEELKSFGVCLCANEIVGLDCVEKYMPYRVAMQFGMNQDVPPKEFTVFMSPSCKGNFSFYVPSRCYKPCVSLEYHNWWKKSKMSDENSMLDVMMIAKQYCEDENHVAIDLDNSSKRKSSSQELVVLEVEGESETKRKALKKKNDGIGTCDNPLEVEDYAWTNLGTSSHPISI